eukprot:TRINITY_DN1710_c0_g1_i2.p1 TRINITY_DN1710_c0_g1~~TRINITY_DN1710_c0_g1_i2.p1  ORF type:complete len:683 (-),score=196.63 TRINITY_DN1710_c0_g1_i2:121-2169(-)
MSILLCSLLLGAGYDAYVVVGTAERSVALCDETSTECPMLMPRPPTPPPTPPPERSTYIIRSRPDMKSKFVAKQKELAQMRQEVSEKRKMEELRLANPEMFAAEPVSDDEEEEVEEDPYHKRRVHAWVLIREGKRGMSSNVYIEPSTAVVYPIDPEESLPYLTVESVFNNRNYWVNMQELPEDGLLQDLSFDLRDNGLWEFVLIDTMSAWLDGDDGVFGGDEKGADLDDVDEDGQVLQLPPSWVSALELDKEKFEIRRPNGHKTILYKKAKLEQWSPYTRDPEDGLVTRLTVYKDKLRKKTLEMREYYENRKDGLHMRFIFPNEQLTKEYFHPGRSFAIKEIVYEKGKTRTMEFYPEARLDGLVKRVQLLGKKVMEYFVDRADRLCYRSVTYESLPPGRKPSTTGVDDLPMQKMCQKFERNRELIADQDVQRRTFNIAGQLTSLVFHLNDDRVTASTRSYTKDGMSSIIQVDPFAKEPKKQELLEEYNRLLQAERDCIASIKDTEREITTILRARIREEENIELVTSIYDTLRNKPKQDARDKARQAQAETANKRVERDYLAPFIQNYVVGKVLPRDEALKAKNACLQGLKERLIERANIIQQRLDEENAELVRRQTAYTRKQDHIDKAEEEEYFRYCNDAMFRIHILEQRRKRHEEQAMQRYIELDQKLRNDPRLAALQTK